MCGIAGWLDFETNITGNDAVLEAMSKTLERRGPDSHGEYKFAEGCLLHRRLAVIDPQNGLQPMTRMKGDASYTITYNGELYNTEELRHDLAARGYEFVTRSDTEVLLTSYIEWGEACLERLNGIYAFAVWNAEKKELFAARDRIGVKPFFYYVYKNGFIFSSELKTLLANPMVEPLLDEDGIRELLLLGPGRKPGSGVIYGVKELKPGEYLKLDRERLTVKPYWFLTAEEHPDSETETIAHTRELLNDAISRQLVSDVPLCCLLSGGLDSSFYPTTAGAGVSMYLDLCLFGRGSLLSGSSLGRGFVCSGGLLGLFRTIDQTAAVLRSSGFKLICRTVEGGQAFALVHIVAALFMQGDAGGKIQRVALFLSARTQQYAGRADLLGVVRHNVTVLLCQ